MTQYLLSVMMVEGEQPPSPEVVEQAYRDVDAFNEQLKADGAWVFAGGLHPPDTATVVDDRDGEIVMTDGPFIETKEHLGGIWIIQATDLDEALAWAARARQACGVRVEVRPFQDEPEE